MGRKYRIRVATSDAMEQMIILGQGATRISARELKIEVESVNKSMREKYLKKSQIINHNRLENHLSQEVLELMEKIRLDK